MTTPTRESGASARPAPPTGRDLTAPARERMRRTRLFGVALLIIAESMIFVPLFAIRFLIAGTGHPDGLDGGLAIVFTITMVASFAAVHVARLSARSEQWHATATALRAAGALGLVTVVGTGLTWADPALDVASPFGGIFYLTTGAHAVHLLIGSVFLAGLAVHAQRGSLAGLRRTLLDATYWFWVFLLVVWLAMGVIFYLI